MDLYQTITDRIISALESGTSPGKALAVQSVGQPANPTAF